MENLDRAVQQALIDNPELNKPLLEEKPAEVVTEAAAAPVEEPVKKQEPSESWKILREDRDRLRQEREEMARDMREMRRLLEEQQQRVAPKEEDDTVHLPGEYDTIEAKHLAELDAKSRLRVKRQEDKLKKLEADVVRIAAENKLMNEFPDYKNILSEDNIRKLEELQPELASSIASNPDPYKMRKAAIGAIKTFIMKSEDERAKELELKAKNAKISDNSVKPIPSVGGINNPASSPLSKANAFSNGLLTQERKQELWKDYVAANNGKYYNFKH